MNSQKLRSVATDLVGGSVGALTAVPIVLSCGAVLYERLGRGFLTTGIAAAFVAAVISALVAGCLGGAPLHVNTPKTTHAAILSGLIGLVAANQTFSSAFVGADRATALVAVTLLTLVLSGLVQISLGTLRLGAIVNFIPFPVLAGFVNGFAVLIIWRQMSHAAGLDGNEQLVAVWSGHAAINYVAAGTALLSAAIVVIGNRHRSRIPAAVAGLVIGTATRWLLVWLVPALPHSPLIGELPAGIPIRLEAFQIWHIADSNAFDKLLMPIVFTGVTLAFVSSIQSLLSTSTTEHLFGERHRSNRELIVQGASNVLSALMGGAPSGGSPNVTRNVHASGGRTSLANFAFAGTMLGLSYGLNRAISLVPYSVMAGVVIATAADAMDGWTRQLIVDFRKGRRALDRFDLGVNLGIVIAVTATVAIIGVLPALAVGFSASLLLFLYRSNMTIIRRTRNIPNLRSRTERSPREREALDVHGGRIAVIAMNGPLFFGAAETASRAITEALERADWVILDLKRVSHLDSSGVMMLKRVDERMHREGKRLYITHVPERSTRRRLMFNLGLAHLVKERRFLVSTNMALSVAEDELLAQLKAADDDVGHELADFPITQTLSTEEKDILSTYVIHQQYAAGSDIRTSGVGLTLYLLAQGRAAIVISEGSETRSGANYCAGMALVQMTNDGDFQRSRLVAETAAVVFALPASALADLRATHPAIVATLMTNLVLHLDQRCDELLEQVLALENS
jgi:SulP family sulfate permease